jgi:hypothetical protein
MGAIVVDSLEFHERIRISDAPMVRCEVHVACTVEA